MASSILFILTDPFSSLLLLSPNENCGLLSVLTILLLYDILFSDLLFLDVALFFFIITSLIDITDALLFLVTSGLLRLFELPSYNNKLLLCYPWGVTLVGSPNCAILCSGDPKLGALCVYSITFVLLTRFIWCLKGSGLQSSRGGRRREG